MSNLAYRSEIDGLRALSVTSVIAFHLKPAFWPGGYLGVDVFFVISGFLITSIILRQLDAGEFSMKTFWLRRFWRLVPALAVMLALVIGASQYILVPPGRVELLGQSLAAVFSFSNVLICRTIGDYWGTGAEELPLLHTWSLSVEEQFYLVAPASFAWAWRQGWNLRIVCAALGLSSLLLSACVWNVNTPLAFYMAPCRAWELIIGAAAAIFLLRRKGQPLQSESGKWWELAGMLSIVGAFAFGDWKTWWAPILPCTGTLLCLLWGGYGLGAKFLRLPAITYIGRASYSLYLWHWPVIMLGKYLSTNPNMLISVGVLLALGLCSYHLIEQPLRSARHPRRKPASVIALGSLAMAFCAVSLASAGIIHSGVPALEDTRSHSFYRDLDQTARISSRNWTNNGAQVVIIGSSHAMMYGQAVEAFVHDLGSQVEHLGASGIGLTKSGEKAVTLNQARLEHVKQRHPRVVLVADKWSLWQKEPDFEKRLSIILQELCTSADQVLIVTQIPSLLVPDNGRHNLRKYLLVSARENQWPATFHGHQEVEQGNQKVEALVANLALPNLKLIDVHGEFIDTTGAIVFYENGALLYDDHHHLSQAGAERAVRGKLGAAIMCALQSHPTADVGTGEQQSSREQNALLPELRELPGAPWRIEQRTPGWMFESSASPPHQGLGALPKE